MKAKGQKSKAGSLKISKNSSALAAALGKANFGPKKMAKMTAKGKK